MTDKVRTWEILRLGRPKKKEDRQLYQTVKCMSCGYKFRTPIYTGTMNNKDGFSCYKRVESDKCVKCGARTPMEEE